MPRLAKELSAIEIKRLTKGGMYAAGGVAGLYVVVSDTNPNAKSWILRATIAKKRHEIGLGSYPEIGLADARDKAAEIKNSIQTGVNPLEAKRAAKSALKASQSKETTFRLAALAYMDSKRAEWKNPKHAQNTLATYAYPLIGDIQPRHVELEHVLKVLEPIWQTKTETAQRLRGRIEAVLDFAKVRGLRAGDNPAAWKGNLDKILAAPSKLKKQTSQHFEALAHNQIGAFIARLQTIDGMAAKCLLFSILTASRSGEARGATWAEIDLKTGLWTIPANRMKADKEHTIPLSKQAIDLIKALPRFENSEYLFTGQSGKPLSDMSMTMLLRRMELKATAHGFRSTFRDWAGECTSFDRQTMEHSLAHQLPDKAEASYHRSTLLPKRAKLMQQWADRCFSPDLNQEQAGKVVNIRGAA